MNPDKRLNHIVVPDYRTKAVPRGVKGSDNIPEMHAEAQERGRRVLANLIHMKQAEASARGENLSEEEIADLLAIPEEDLAEGN